MDQRILLAPSPVIQLQSWAWAQESWATGHPPATAMMCADRPDQLGEPLAWHLVERLQHVHDLGDHQIRQQQLVAGREELGCPCRLRRWVAGQVADQDTWCRRTRSPPGAHPGGANLAAHLLPGSPAPAGRAGSPRRRGRAGRRCGEHGALPPGVQPERLADRLEQDDLALVTDRSGGGETRTPPWVASRFASLTSSDGQIRLLTSTRALPIAFRHLPLLDSTSTGGAPYLRPIRALEDRQASELRPCPNQRGRTRPNRAGPMGHEGMPHAQG
jgi:hypothetical protein